MDILKQLLADKGSVLLPLLTSKLGMSGDQAANFLPAAAQKIIGAVSGGGLDLGALLGGGDLGALISKIDIPGLARETGVDKETAAKGVQTVAPPLLAGLKEKAGSAEGMLSMLGGAGKGDLLGKAGSALGGFLKR